MRLRQYPVPLMSDQIVQDWAVELAARHHCTVETFLEKPDHLISFPMQSLRIELMDRSVVEFRYAFALVSEARRAIAVFTEHCGHHVFPYHDAKVFLEGELMYSQAGYQGNWSSP